MLRILLYLTHFKGEFGRVRTKVYRGYLLSIDILSAYVVFLPSAGSKFLADHNNLKIIPFGTAMRGLRYM